jgi:hypothetical protein
MKIDSLEMIGYDAETDGFPSSVFSNLSPRPLPYRWDVRGDSVTEPLGSVLVVCATPRGCCHTRHFATYNSSTANRREGIVKTCGLACHDEVARSVAGRGRSCRSSDQDPLLAIGSVVGTQPVTNG